jgi:hypothetical protein
MARIIPWLAAAMLLLLPRVTVAQTPNPGSFQLVTSPHGYQFQVPDDWQEQPLDELPFSVDLFYNSPDGRQNVATAAFHGQSPAAADLLPQLADSFLAGVARTQRAKAGSDPNVFQQAQPASVGNADAGLELREVMSQADGRVEVVATRIAARGQDVFVFTLTVPQDVYSSDPAVGQILDSFALSP